jgi:hypothetical protein
VSTVGLINRCSSGWFGIAGMAAIGHGAMTGLSP